MKKQLFICALIFLFAGTIRSYAQMAFTPNYDKLADTTAYPNTINVIGGYIHNNVNTSTSLTMQILNSNLPPGWKISMCVQGNCFPVGYNSHTFIIDPSANAGAEVDFHVGTTYGTGYATFKFTNNSNTADNVILNCSFTMLSPSASVAKAEIAGERTISQNFPNPLVSQTTIDYSLTDNSKATFILFDVTGKKVKQLPLESKEGQIILNASDFSKGFYFYTIEQNNKAIARKRLIVQ